MQPNASKENRAFIAVLADLGSDSVFEKGAVIVSEGERGGSLFVIHSGRAQVYASAAGERKVLIDEHGPRDYFGEMSLDGNVRSAPAPDMYSLDKENLRPTFPAMGNISR